MIGAGEVVGGTGADNGVLERGGQDSVEAVTGEQLVRVSDLANLETNLSAGAEGGGSTLYPEIAALDFLAAWREREKVRKQLEKDRKRARQESLTCAMEKVEEKVEDTREDVEAEDWRGQEFEAAVAIGHRLGREEWRRNEDGGAQVKRMHLDLVPLAPSLRESLEKEAGETSAPVEQENDDMKASEVGQRIDVQVDRGMREPKSTASPQVCLCVSVYVYVW